MNYGRVAAIATWTVVLLISYTALIPSTRLLPSQSEILEQERLVDAIVLVAMGEMAADSMIDFSISSIRRIGNWRGEIYVLTDRKSCFARSAIDFDLHLIEMEPLDSIIKIKALKPKLMKYLPVTVRGALYLDVDIIVTRDLGSFLTDLRDTVRHSITVRKEKEKALIKRLQETGDGIGEVKWSNSLSLSSFDYGAFLDAKGHYVGFCSGCEKWHTGVVWLQRQSEEISMKGNETRISSGHGALSQNNMSSSEMKKEKDRETEIEIESCMSAWERILLSGLFNTDQESIDEAERSGACPHTLILPGRHLLFAKDYVGMALTSGQTFLHLTAAGCSVGENNLVVTLGHGLHAIQLTKIQKYLITDR